MTECNQVAVVLLISIWLCNGWWLHLNCQDNLRQIGRPVIFDILFHIFVTTVKQMLLTSKDCIFWGMECISFEKNRFMIGIYLSTKSGKILIKSSSACWVSLPFKFLVASLSWSARLDQLSQNLFTQLWFPYSFFYFGTY